MSNEKEFSTKYTLDYKTYKEFSNGYIATKKSSIITLFVVLALLVLCIILRDYETVITFGIIFLIFAFLIKVTGRNKLQYKRYKSLNNNEDLEANIKIGKEKIISTSKKGDTASYEFSQIVGITDKNMLKQVADSSNITKGCCKQLTHDEIYEILVECL